MCAINGFNFPDKNLILRMKQFTSNRGSDAEGLYMDENITIFHLFFINISFNYL